MKTLRPSLAVLLALSAISLGGCAHLPDRIAAMFARTKAVETRPITSGPQLAKVLDLAADRSETEDIALSRSDRLYHQAVTAMKARDYGRALDLLQLARADAPTDPRITNALGVIYDKLGRFDLSDRYYRLALAADPSSTVVRTNMRYSARLQGKVEAFADLAPATNPPAASAPQSASAINLAMAEGDVHIQTPVLVGRPVLIVNASRTPGLTAKVQAVLARQGWSVASQQAPGGPLNRGARLSFPERHIAAASALARTLPFPVEMAPCRNSCDRLTLTLGAQTRWKS